MRVLPAIVLTFMLLPVALAYMPPGGIIGPQIAGINPGLLDIFAHMKQQWTIEGDEFSNCTLSQATLAGDGSVMLGVAPGNTLGTIQHLKPLGYTTAQGVPSIFPNNESKYMIAYTEGEFVRANVFNPNGTLLGIYTIADGSHPFVYSYGRDFVVAYVTGDKHNIAYRKVAPEGGIGTERTVATGIAPDEPVISVSSGGVALVAWSWTSSLMGWKMFNVTSGYPLATGGSISGARRADVINTGQFFVMPFEYYNAGQYDIRVALFSASSHTLLSIKAIATSPAANEQYPSVRAFTDGYRIAWAVTNGTTRAVKARDFYFSGAPMYYEQTLATSTTKYFYYTTIAQVADATALIAWSKCDNAAALNEMGVGECEVEGRRVSSWNVPFALTVGIANGSATIAGYRATWPDATVVSGDFIIAYNYKDSGMYSQEVKYRAYGSIPYNSAAVTSPVFDAGQVVSFDSIQWGAEGNVRLRYWVGNSTPVSPTFTSSYSTSAGVPIGKKGRYFQWKAELTRSSDPKLDSVTVNYSQIAPTSIQLATCDPVMLADGTSTTCVEATVLDQYNSPMQNQTVTFTANRGHLLAGTNKTGADGKAVTALRSGTEPGTATLTASAGDASNSTTVTMTDAWGGVFVNAEPAAIKADGADAATISAMVQKTDGNPFPGQTVSFTTTIGTLDHPSCTTDAEGVCSVVLTAGTAAGTAAVAASSGSQSGSVNITLAAVPATMQLEVSTPALEVGGSETALVTATVRDGEGNPYEGAPVSFSIDLGNLSTGTNTTNAGGQAATWVTAGMEPGTATILATTADVSQNATIDFMIPAEATPTPGPTPEETPTPAESPTATPEATPTPAGTATPAASPTVQPSATPLECRMSLCDCRCHPAGQTPEDLTGRICGINCVAEFNATGCRVEGSDCVTEYAPDTITECQMSLCDCSCYPAGMTPEERDGRLCGINCLGLFNITGCRLEGNACVVEYAASPTPAPSATVTPAPTATPGPVTPQDNTWLYVALIIAVLLLGIIIVGAVILLGGVGGLAYFLGRRGAPPKGGKPPKKGKAKPEGEAEGGEE